MSYEQIALQLWGNAHVYRASGEDKLNSEKHLRRIEREIEAACKAEALGAVERMLLKERDKAVETARAVTKERRELKEVNKELKEKIADLEAKLKTLGSELKSTTTELEKTKRKKVPKSVRNKKPKRTSPLKDKLPKEPPQHKDAL